MSLLLDYTAQKMKFSIKDIFSKCDQIPSFLRISCSVQVHVESIIFIIDFEEIIVI